MNEIFCKERLPLMKKYMHVFAKYDKGTKKIFKLKKNIYFEYRLT